jgi:long-chain acyl-CoA synthetase
LFHITGFQVELCSAWLARGMLLLNYRFDPQLVLDSMLVNRPTFTICTITAYIAMMSCAEASANHFSSFHTLYCGGAPIPPPVLERFEQRFGRRISSAYGMTESCAPTHVCPEEMRVPVDSALGCTSIGIPVSNVEILIRRADGCPANSGEAGELLIRGPMLMDGYFNNPQISAETLRDGWLHTGDIACMDAQGWFFLVDRKKDVIICSGFKVWPREVEDVIYGHSSVREAAVVGVPDSYRGETIKAYISLRPGMDLVIDELLQLCRAKLAGYKVPRLVEVLPDLPKTASGKIMRVELRKLAARG